MIAGGSILEELERERKHSESGFYPASRYGYTEHKHPQTQIKQSNPFSLQNPLLPTPFPHPRTSHQTTPSPLRPPNPNNHLLLSPRRRRSPKRHSSHGTMTYNPPRSHPHVVARRRRLTPHKSVVPRYRHVPFGHEDDGFLTDDAGRAAQGDEVVYSREDVGAG